MNATIQSMERGIDLKERSKDRPELWNPTCGSCSHQMVQAIASIERSLDDRGFGSDVIRGIVANNLLGIEELNKCVPIQALRYRIVGDQLYAEDGTNVFTLLRPDENSFVIDNNGLPPSFVDQTEATFRNVMNGNGGVEFSFSPAEWFKDSDYGMLQVMMRDPNDPTMMTTMFFQLPKDTDQAFAAIQELTGQKVTTSATPEGITLFNIPKADRNEMFSVDEVYNAIRSTANPRSLEDAVHLQRILESYGGEVRDPNYFTELNRRIDEVTHEWLGEMNGMTDSQKKEYVKGKTIQILSDAEDELMRRGKQSGPDNSILESGNPDVKGAVDLFDRQGLVVNTSTEEPFGKGIGLGNSIEADSGVRDNQSVKDQEYNGVSEKSSVLSAHSELASAVSLVNADSVMVASRTQNSAGIAVVSIQNNGSLTGSFSKTNEKTISSDLSGTQKSLSNTAQPKGLGNLRDTYGSNGESNWFQDKTRSSISPLSPSFSSFFSSSPSMDRKSLALQTGGQPVRFATLDSLPGYERFRQINPGVLPATPRRGAAIVENNNRIIDNIRFSNVNGDVRFTKVNETTSSKTVIAERKYSEDIIRRYTSKALTTREQYKNYIDSLKKDFDHLRQRPHAKPQASLMVTVLSARDIQSILRRVQLAINQKLATPQALNITNLVVKSLNLERYVSTLNAKQLSLLVGNSRALLKSILLNQSNITVPGHTGPKLLGFIEQVLRAKIQSIGANDIAAKNLLAHRQLLITAIKELGDFRKILLSVRSNATNPQAKRPENVPEKLRLLFLQLLKAGVVDELLAADDDWLMSLLEVRRQRTKREMRFVTDNTRDRISLLQAKYRRKGFQRVGWERRHTKQRSDATPKNSRIQVSTSVAPSNQLQTSRTFENNKSKKNFVG